MQSFTYTIQVTAENKALADTVVRERINHDEDLGFQYTVEVREEQPSPSMEACPAFRRQVTSDQFSEILERYSDNGYTNIHGGDIIIDLFHIEDEESRQEFADILAIPVDDIPDDGLVTIHP